MNDETNTECRGLPPGWSPGACRDSWPLFTRLGLAAGIAGAFWRAVVNPGDGLPSIAFWLLLFAAASSSDQA